MPGVSIGLLPCSRGVLATLPVLGTVPGVSIGLLPCSRGVVAWNHRCLGRFAGDGPRPDCRFAGLGACRSTPRVQGTCRETATRAVARALELNASDAPSSSSSPFVKRVTNSSVHIHSPQCCTSGLDRALCVDNLALMLGRQPRQAQPDFALSAVTRSCDVSALGVFLLNRFSLVSSMPALLECKFQPCPVPEPTRSFKFQPCPVPEPTRSLPQNVAQVCHSNLTRRCFAMHHLSSSEGHHRENTAAARLGIPSKVTSTEQGSQTQLRLPMPGDTGTPSRVTEHRLCLERRGIWRVIVTAREP